MNTRTAGILIAVLASLSIAAAAYTNTVVAAKMRPPPARVILYANGHPIAAMSDPPVLNFVYQLMHPIIGLQGHEVTDISGNTQNEPITPLRGINLNYAYKVVLVLDPLQYNYRLSTLYIESYPVNNAQDINIQSLQQSILLTITTSFLINANATIYGLALIVDNGHFKTLIMYDPLQQPYQVKPGDVITVQYKVEVG